MQLHSPKKSFFIWSFILSAAALFLWLLAPVLAPFVFAAVLAYALSPAVDRFDGLARGRVPRVLTVLVVELVFLLVLLAILLLVIPILFKEAPLLQQQLPALLELFNRVLQPLLERSGIHFRLDVEGIKAVALEYFQANAQETLGSVLNSLKLGGSLAFALIGYAILIPVVLFYLLMQWPHFMQRLLIFVPPRMRLLVGSFVQESDAVLGQYLRGQLLVMGVLALYYSLSLALLGLDLALPIGVFTGLAIFVPYLGFGLGLFLATLASVLEFSATAGLGYALLKVAVVYGFGQVLESFFLTPKLVGERIGLHPLAVIFALLAFGQLFGFVGILVALPVSAVLLVAIRRGIAKYTDSNFYRS